MREDREYSAEEVAGILAKGIGPEALENWPLTSLPEYVIGVARAKAAVEGGDDFGQLDDALRPRRALRTEWGMLVVDHSQDNDGDGATLAILGYLKADPYLELPHLRKEAETVGIYLSDLISDALVTSTIQSLLAHGIDWADNDDTGQVFCLMGFDEPGDPLAFDELGKALGCWLEAAGIERLVAACQKQDYLRKVDWSSGLPVSQMQVH
ncbi:hypothetical protein [Cupriavidus basilensis]|uniref:hypothetical protein n=1 Tax=Cupriavidus basilensis TaxID=68895 RepID=UPI0020A66167|nr:hypothetical protein [Cupriavidus basilensis]MCP3024025.1 hypothetical protein [Cupriavidus basilensis]